MTKHYYLEVPYVNDGKEEMTTLERFWGLTTIQTVLWALHEYQQTEHTMTVYLSRPEVLSTMELKSQDHQCMLQTSNVTINVWLSNTV